MTFRTIQFEEPEPGIGFLTLNRPDSLNSLTMDMVEELHVFFCELTNSYEVRALLIAGHVTPAPGPAGREIRCHEEPHNRTFQYEISHRSGGGWRA